MKLKKFYRDDLPANILNRLDAEYAKQLSAMRDAVSTEQWSAEQQKIQKQMIIPLLAKYRTLLCFGLAQDRAKALTEKYSAHSARQFNKLVKMFSHLPNFRKLFSKMFKKQMAVPGIWEHEFKKDNEEMMVFDVTKCLWKETCNFFDYPEICEIFCNNDWVVFGDIKKLHLERAGTLGLGDEKCDFRFVFNEKK